MNLKKLLTAASRNVAGADAVAPFRLEMVEEGEDGVDIEMPDLEPAGADAVPVCGKNREKLEARGVALDGVPAGPQVTGEMLPQERGQWRCEPGHVVSFPVVM